MSAYSSLQLTVASTLHFVYHLIFTITCHVGTLTPFHTWGLRPKDGKDAAPRWQPLALNTCDSRIQALRSHFTTWHHLHQLHACHQHRALKRCTCSFVESHLHSNPVKQARQRSQNFLKEETEAQMRRNVPHGHTWMPYPLGDTTRNSKERKRQETTHRGSFKEAVKWRNCCLVKTHTFLFSVIILTRVLWLDDKYGLLLITFTAHTSAVAGEKDNDRLHE